MIYETFREAIQNIWSNKFRTLLTMLGIIIGVMAVMVIVGLGNGMTTSIQNELCRYGHQPPDRADHGLRLPFCQSQGLL